MSTPTSDEQAPVTEIPVTLYVTEEVEHEITTTIPEMDLDKLRAQGVDLTDHAAVLKAWIEVLDTDDGVITDVIGDKTLTEVTERRVGVSLRKTTTAA